MSMIGQKQRVAMAYRLQANGTAEKMVHNYPSYQNVCVKGGPKGLGRVCRKTSFRIEYGTGEGSRGDSVLLDMRVRRVQYFRGHGLTQ